MDIMDSVYIHVYDFELCTKNVFINNEVNVSQGNCQKEIWNLTITIFRFDVDCKPTIMCK